MTIAIEKLTKLISDFSFDKFLEDNNEIQYECTIDKEYLSSLREECTELNTSFRLSLFRGSQQHYVTNETTAQELTDILDMFYQDSLSARLSIKKYNFFDQKFEGLYNIIICHDLNWFINEIEGKNLVDFENQLFTQNKPTIVGIVETYDDFAPLKNGYINIVMANELKCFDEGWEKNYNQNISNIDNALTLNQKRNENILWNEGSIKITPDYLYFEDSHPYLEDILEIFALHFTSSTIGYIASVTTYNNSEYKSVFTGLKNITINHRLDIEDVDFKSLKTLYSYYLWIYTEKENITDKIQLVQNIASMQVKQDSNLNSFLNIIEELKESTIENYKAYIENSIEDFLNQRKSLEELIRYTSSEIEKQVNNITSLMVKNLYGIIAASITAVVSIGRFANLDILPYILYTYAGFMILLTIYFSLFAIFNMNSKKSFYISRKKEFFKYFTSDKINQLEGNTITTQKRIFWSFLVVTSIINILISLGATFVGVYIHTGFNIYTYFFN